MPRYRRVSGGMGKQPAKEPKKRRRAPLAPPPADVAPRKKREPLPVTAASFPKPRCKNHVPVTIIEAPPKLASAVLPATAGTDDPAPMPEEAPSTQYLRFSAGILYTTHLNGITLRELLSRPPYKGAIGMRQVEQWCAADHWVERRKRNMEEWAEQISRKIGSEVVRKRLEDLKRLDGMVEEAAKRLEQGGNEKLPTKSWESLANALVRVMTLRDALFEKVTSELIPTPSAPQTAPDGTSTALALPKPKLDAEEARAAASAVLRMRRESIRAELAATKAQSEDAPPGAAAPAKAGP